MLENLFEYAQTYGILHFSQYLFLFILSLNPAVFRLFKWHHYALFFVGVLASIFNHRAILPFLMLIVLDLDYDRMDNRTRFWIAVFFSLSILNIMVFGGWSKV